MQVLDLRVSVWCVIPIVDPPDRVLSSGDSKNPCNETAAREEHLLDIITLNVW